MSTDRTAGAPTVSVVVPSYDNADHIEQTMVSVLNQTYDALEVVVSDHGSTDGTWELLQRFAHDPRVRLVRIEPGGGAERNWNHATSLATGELLKLVCGDDLLAPSCVERQVAALRACGDGVVMVAAQRDLVDATGRRVAAARGLAGLSGRVPGRVAVRRTLLAGTNIFGEPACVLLRRSALEAAGGWQGEDGYVIDLATYVQVLDHGDLVAVPQSLAAFRISAGQWSVRLQREQGRQVRRLFRTVAAETGSGVSGLDRARSAVMVSLRSAQRRLAYLLLARRM